MQRNWIGRSDGARVKFALEGDPSTQIEVFTTRIDTIFGATFVLLGPEHPLVHELTERSRDSAALRKQVQGFRLQDRRARISGELEKQGFDTGFRAINPFTHEPVPVWVANFVLGDYGTGAIMAVPAHDERDFEFATKYGLPIRPVVVAALLRPMRLNKPLPMTEVRHQRRFRRVQRPSNRGGAETDDRRGPEAGHRRGHGAGTG